MAADRLPPGQFCTTLADAKTLDELLSGPCPVPAVLPPGLRRRFRQGWSGFRAVRASYRPGDVGLIVESGQKLIGQFLPPAKAREILADEYAPTVGGLLDHAGPADVLILVLSTRRAVAGFGIFGVLPEGTPSEERSHVN